MKPGRTVNTDERLKQIRERQRNRKTSKWDSHGRSMLTDIDFLLSLVDSQAAGEYDTRVMNEIRERVTDGYESASSRNVTTVAALTLKDLHYVLSSHDGQCRRGATRMRAACVDVAEDYRQRIEYEDDEGVREAMFGDMVMKIGALTLDQVVEKESKWNEKDNDHTEKNGEYFEVKRLASSIASVINYGALDERQYRLRLLLIEFADEIKRGAIEP